MVGGKTVLICEQRTPPVVFAVDDDSSWFFSSPKSTGVKDGWLAGFNSPPDFF